MTPAEQARVFLAMMLCGAALGAANTLLGAVRRGTLMTAAADLFLGVLLAAGMVAVGLVMRAESFRAYAFAAVASGWALYACSVGTIVRFLAEKLRSLSKKVKK